MAFPGDRIVHVRGPEGVRTSRRQHRLLGLKGTLGPDGQPLVDGMPWESEEVLALVKEAAGADAWLAAYDDPERFDILPLLVATDGAVAEFGRDIHEGYGRHSEGDILFLNASVCDGRYRPRNAPNVITLDTEGCVE